MKKDEFYRNREQLNHPIYDKHTLRSILSEIFQQLSITYGSIQEDIFRIKEILAKGELSYQIPPTSKLILVGGGSGTATVGRSLYRTGIKRFNMLANTGEMGRDSKTGLSLGGGMIFEEIPTAIDCMDILKQAIHATPRELRTSIHSLLDEQKPPHMKLGYLVFEALRQLKNDPQMAIDFLNFWMQNPYRVMPSTTDRTELFLSLNEIEIDCNVYWLRTEPDEIADHPVMKPRVSLSKYAKEAVDNAKTIIVGPGDVFFSVLPHWGIDGFKEALQANTDSMVILIVNLTARERDITNFKLTDYLDTYAKFLPQDRELIAVVNTGTVSTNEPLIDNVPKQNLYRNYSLVRADIAGNQISSNNQLIHDESKLGDILQSLLLPQNKYEK